MSTHDPAKIRNLAFIGSPGSGKTSLVEAVLNVTGVTSRMGTVKDGTTMSDFDAEEKEKQHSISLAVMHAEHKGHHYNLLDTPGYPDFAGEAAAGLGACETAVFCVNASEGLTFPGRRTWGLADAAGRARCMVVTHADQGEFDPMTLATEIGEALGARCLPVVVPDGVGAAFKGVKAVPFTSDGGDLSALTEALVEAVVEVDEAAMTRYLEEDVPPDDAEVADLLRRSVVSGLVVPTLFVNCLDAGGVEAFLEFAAKCLPSPLDGPFFCDVDGEIVKPDSTEPTGFVFKTIVDPFVGKLCLLRIVSGEFTDGHHLNLPRTGKSERLTGIQAKQGKEQKAVGSAGTGDIVAVAKMEHLETSDTLCDPAHEIVFRSIAFPKPMVVRAISPVDHADEVKMSTALRRLAAEDATFVYERDEATGQLVVRGVTLMHLETSLRRVQERNKVEMKVDIPRVALRETCATKADGHHRHKKQTGGRGQFAEVYLKVEPAPRGTGLAFENEVVGGSIPKNFIPAVEKGVREVMATGIIAGYSVVDVTVRVYDGKYHDVDSDEASFKKAGARAFKDAFMKGRPRLLEPILDLEVAVPSRFMGAITSDMTSRRGQISGMDSLGDIQIVKAHVPQREILTYPTALHSMTSGEGSFTAEFKDYEVVPPNVQQEIMAEFKPEDEED